MLIPSDLKKWLKMRIPKCIYSNAILFYIEALEDDVGSKIGEIAKFENRIKRLEAAAPKWISVEERLPEIDMQQVLCVIKPGLGTWVCEGYYSEIRNRVCPSDADLAMYKVTHWMPLPEPPEEETC